MTEPTPFDMSTPSVTDIQKALNDMPKSKSDDTHANLNPSSQASAPASVSTLNATGIPTPTRQTASVYDKYLPENNPFSKYYKAVSHHIYWENPVHSGISLAAILLILIFNMVLSVFTVVSFLCMVVTTLGVGYFIAISALHGVFGGSSGHPLEYYHRKQPYQITRQQGEYISEQVLGGINILLIELQRVIFVENLATSIKAIGFFFFMWILSFLPFNVLLILITIAAYSLPLGYRNNKELIDSHMQTAQEQIRVHMDKGMIVGRKKAYEAWSFIQNKLAEKDVTIPYLGKIKRTDEIHKKTTDVDSKSKAE